MAAAGGEHGVEHPVGRGEVALHEDGGQGEDVPDVVEAVAGVVFRKVVSGAEVDPEEVAEGIIVLDAVEAAEGDAAGVGVGGVYGIEEVVEVLGEEIAFLGGGLFGALGGGHGPLVDVEEDARPDFAVGGDEGVGGVFVEIEFSLVGAVAVAIPAVFLEEGEDGLGEAVFFAGGGEARGEQGQASERHGGEGGVAHGGGNGAKKLRLPLRLSYPKGGSADCGKRRAFPLRGWLRGGSWRVMSSARQSLLELLRRKSVMYGDFTLASGKRSDFYCDARLTTLDPQGAVWLGEVAWGLIQEKAAALGVSPVAVGGLTMGADPVALAIGIGSVRAGGPGLQCFSIRKQAKAHGRTKLIEGNFQAGDTVVVVDDTITTGGSTLEAIEKIRAEGGKVAFALVLVDRSEGGLEAIEATGVPVVAIFSRADIDSARGTS